MRWAHASDPRMSGPYFALGRDRAAFALGSDSVAGRPLLRGAATLNGSSVPHGHESVSETGHFCAGHMIPVCLALTLRWAETGPILRWARVPLLCPYFALGLDFVTCALTRVSTGNPFYIGRALSLCTRLTLAEKPEPCPFRLGARLAGYPARASLKPARTSRFPLCTGVRVESVARPTLALRVLG